jgi:hypothetical protein
MKVAGSAGWYTIPLAREVWRIIPTSRDGRWAIVVSSGPNQEQTAMQYAVPVDGGASVPLLAAPNSYWQAVGRAAKNDIEQMRQRARPARDTIARWVRQIAAWRRTRGTRRDERSVRPYPVPCRPLRGRWHPAARRSTRGFLHFRRLVSRWQVGLCDIRIERIRHFDCDAKQGFLIYNPINHGVLQGVAFEIFHGNEDSAVLIADIVNGADIWVI